MTRPSLAAHSPIDRPDSALLCGLLLAWMLLGLGVAGEAGAEAAPAPVRIAVAPFAAVEASDTEGSEESSSPIGLPLGRRVADALARELALSTRHLNRLFCHRISCRLR